MCFAAVLDLLKPLGANRDRIYRAISLGYVDRPPVDASRRFVFSDCHVAQLRDYLRTHIRRRPQDAPALATA